MKKSISLGLLTILISTKSILACQYDPEFDYDDIDSSDISIAIASVSEVRVETLETSCLIVEYENAEYLLGVGNTQFSVTTCTDDVYDADVMASDKDVLDFFGFIPSTEVLVGVVRPPDSADGLRYATPTCWGPLHYNLQTMTAEQRAKLLNEIESVVEMVQ